MSGLNGTILRGESRIGGKVFGDSAGKKRRFYCLDEHTWVWSEDSVTVFYKINPTNVHKSNDGASWRLAGKNETKRLYKAAKVYKSLVETRVYDSLLALR